MPWFYLFVAGLLEIGWPLGFKLSQVSATNKMVLDCIFCDKHAWQRLFSLDGTKIDPHWNSLRSLYQHWSIRCFHNRDHFVQRSGFIIKDAVGILVDFRDYRLEAIQRLMLLLSL